MLYSVTMFDMVDMISDLLQMNNNTPTLALLI